MSPYDWVKTGVAVVCIGIFACLIICLVRGGRYNDLPIKHACSRCGGGDSEPTGMCDAETFAPEWECTRCGTKFHAEYEE